ncbi:hypothetical protein J2S09_001284 [Bacillus fengqiuensis]|nr:hypothetical protein [Bacillus fengqiuensis]
MKNAEYRKWLIFTRFIIAFLFIVTSVFLLYAGFFLDASIMRKLFSIAAGVSGSVFFGKVSLVLLTGLLKKKTLFCYDRQIIKVGKESADWKEIVQVKDEEANAGIFGLTSPGYVLYCKDGRSIHIPIYYGLNTKERYRIFKELKRLVSQNGNI